MEVVFDEALADEILDSYELKILLVTVGWKGCHEFKRLLLVTANMMPKKLEKKNEKISSCL